MRRWGRRRGDAVDVRIPSTCNRSVHLKLDSPVTLEISSTHYLSTRHRGIVLSLGNGSGHRLLVSPFDSGFQMRINGLKLNLEMGPSTHDNLKGDMRRHSVNYLSPTISFLINSRTTQLLKEKSKWL